MERVPLATTPTLQNLAASHTVLTEWLDLILQAYQIEGIQPFGWSYVRCWSFMKIKTDRFRPARLGAVDYRQRRPSSVPQVIY